MSKVKYYYDPETLSYRKIERKKRRTFKYISVFLLASALFGFLSVFISSQYIESPKERALKRELSNLQLQYQLINKKMNEAEAVLSSIEDRDNNIYRLYFEANPIPEEQRRAGFGGINRYKDLEGFNNSKLIIETNKRLDILQKQIVVQSKSLDEIAKLAEEKEKLLAAIPAIQPVRNEDLRRMASGYGVRSDPFTKARKMHWGMDFSAPRGTPIYATGDGVVTRADNRATGYGNHIEIDHGYGYVTIYGHLYKYNVKKNQKVKRGDLIGFVGSTGRSEAPHLHYEVHKDGERINPINFYYGSLTAEEFDELLQHASMENQSLD
ncbi:M23 family metallopeptidase [Mangrovimonas sp. AS39]|uniref:M23 family metallopeptidase n=1 Tax=Mangrovimonas TaxID=1211036 RepID=UPI0006B40548|nr:MULTISPECIES: M23 family metallopeptidase [Mangrovimonas]MCF1192529.1 M23 family metallopeptidase [Mangrovimonas futianensis]MCF1196141.1 M23 family metallopeptidase [Mangrovimonas futianensis]MCF1422526.1 M23 family metallopeptidase [Mangrovimonas futianensis]NIK93128.1 M23 family metallopeptidase [Mangrovimonas sp. CR14]